MHSQEEPEQEQEATMMATSSSSKSNSSKKSKRKDRSSEKKKSSKSKKKDKEAQRRSSTKSSSNSKKDSSFSEASQDKKKQRRRRIPGNVRFSKHDQIFEIPHIDDLPGQEVDDVWFSPEEMKQIRRAAVTIVKGMSDEDAQMRLNGLSTIRRSLRSQLSRSSSDSDLLLEEGNNTRCQTPSSPSSSSKALDLDDSYRGLESNTREHMKKRSAENSIMQDTVFRLQPFKSNPPLQPGVDIDQMISDLLSKYSSPSVTLAIRRAKRDEKAAMKIHHNDNESSKSKRIKDSRCNPSVDYIRS